MSVPVPPNVIDVSHASKRLSIWRLVGGVLVGLLVLRLAIFLVSNERFEWGVVAQFLFDASVMRGLWMTILLTAIAMTLGSILGTVLAAGQLSDFWLIRLVCQLYVGVFRSVPPLVQLIFWYNLAYLVPRIAIGVPFGPELFAWNANDLITPFTAAVIGLSLHEAAYMAEIVRSGVLSVDQGQKDAAKAMGFSDRETFMRIILPQSMRVMLPPTGSQVISQLKGTSLVSVIAMGDLLRSVQVIYNVNYKVVPLLIVAVIWYLVVVIILTLIQRRIEKRFGRGYTATASGPGRSKRKGKDTIAEVLDEGVRE